MSEHSFDVSPCVYLDVVRPMSVKSSSLQLGANKARISPKVAISMFETDDEAVRFRGIRGIAQQIRDVCARQQLVQPHGTARDTASGCELIRA